MKILAIGTHAHTFVDDSCADLPAIDQDLADMGQQRYRRIDRFIKLALLGSGRCHNEKPVPHNTTVCLVSGMAALTNTTAVQRTMLAQHKPPKPIHFVNTLSNAAGFYVADNLGLHGKNLFISRGDQSFEAGLALAKQELICAPQTPVLLGAVDECPLPIHEHRQRIKVSSDRAMAEGSHWWLLSNDSDSDEQTIASIDFSITFPTWQAVKRWLEEHNKTYDYIVFQHSTAFTRAQIEHCQKYTCARQFSSDLGEYGTRSAGVMTAFLQNQNQDSLFSISADVWGRFHIMAVSP